MKIKIKTKDSGGGKSSANKTKEVKEKEKEKEKAVEAETPVKAVEKEIVYPAVPYNAGQCLSVLPTLCNFMV